MTINRLIEETLSSTGVPVSPLVYRGKEKTYITFFLYNEMNVLFLDDDAEEGQLSVQVDVWSTGDYTSVVSDVKRLMKRAGFSQNSGFETYEDDTKIYHRVLRYYYEKTGGI